MPPCLPTDPVARKAATGSVGKLRPSGPPGSLICEYIQNVQAQWQSFKLSYFRAAISFWALKMLSAGMAPRTEEVG